MSRAHSLNNPSATDLSLIDKVVAVDKVMANEIRQGHQGWFEEPHDDRDKMYKAPENFTVASYINLWKQYPEAQITPYDQGNTNTCVANATAAALWYELKFTKQPLMQPTGPSRLFIYWNARVSELAAGVSRAPANDGCYCRRAPRSLEKLGGCTEQTWRFAANRAQLEPTQEAYTSAMECKIDVYWRLDPSRLVEDLTQSQMIDDGQTTLLSVRQCLSEGFPVIFGYKNYSSHTPWKKHDDGTWMLPDLWKDDTVKAGEKPGDFGGHAVLIIGYDDAKGVVICQNSWGSNASREGTPIFYMPYSWILDYYATADFWTLRRNLEGKSR